MGSIPPPRGGLNKSTRVPTIDVTTQGRDNIKHVMDKTAPRIRVLRVWALLQSRVLRKYPDVRRLLDKR